LRASDPAQRADIETYLRQQANRLEVREILEKAPHPVRIESFIEVLSEASEGNFTYLGFVEAVS
jgi:hypothetical protein